MKHALFLLLFAPEFAVAQQDNGQAKPNEEFLFGFKTASGKTLSICAAKDASYVVYRFGAPNKIELEYPADKSLSPDSCFKYQFYSRGGGAQNLAMHDGALRFQVNDFEYEVFDAWNSADNKTLVGVRVKNLKTGKETTIKGVKPTGGLIRLQDYLKNSY